MVLVDSKRPFITLLVVVALILLSIIVYQEYLKYTERDIITIYTGAGAVKIRIEYATTPEEWQKGLMNRPSLGKNSGLFFIFPDETNRNFWMKNVLTPLDIIFISSKGRVNEITTLNPCQETKTCQSYNSKTPVQYVLEINAGAAEKWKIIEGDIVELPKL